MEDYQVRLQTETEELATKVNKLHDFMKTRTFYLLSRVKKDLMYDQLHAMLTYLQILGKRCELEEIPLFQVKEDFDEHITHPDFDDYMNHYSGAKDK